MRFVLEQSAEACAEALVGVQAAAESDECAARRGARRTRRGRRAGWPSRHRLPGAATVGRHWVCMMVMGGGPRSGLGAAQRDFFDILAG